MDYADQLIAEGRNNVNHSGNYTHKCRCWGKCFDEYKKQALGMSERKFKSLFGAKEFNQSSYEMPDPDPKICKPCFVGFSCGCYHKKACPQRMTSSKIIITKVYYGPWREFHVTETGIWTSIECPKCGYSETWSVGDGDERF